MIPQRFDLKANQRLDQYTIVRELGQGTYGIVYQAVDAFDQNYAIKVLKLHGIIEESDRKMVSLRFDGEFQTGQIKSSHLVGSVSKGVYLGNPYIVMEYMPGDSLDKIIPKISGVDQAVRLGSGILMGLADLHRQDIIHRDIKPENVLIDATGRPRLTDFGIAGFLNARVTVKNFLNRVQAVFGTYAYIAPEQLKDFQKFKTTSPRTDIFSFGVMFYEMLSRGYLPFGNLETHDDLAKYIRNARDGNIRPLANFCPGVPPHLESVIRRCLEPRYDHRIASVEELLAEINRGQPADPHSPVPSPVPPVRPPGPAYSLMAELVVTAGDDFQRVYRLGGMVKGNRPTMIRIGFFDAASPRRNEVELTEKATSFISNYHATIEHYPGHRRWLIRDGQFRTRAGRKGWHPSTNGLFINHNRVVPGTAVDLTDNSIIQVGDTTLRFRFIK